MVRQGLSPEVKLRRLPACVFVAVLALAAGALPASALEHGERRAGGLQAFEAAKRFGMGNVWIAPGRSLQACLTGFRNRDTLAPRAVKPRRPKAERSLPHHAYLGIEAKLLTCGPFSLGWDE